MEKNRSIPGNIERKFLENLENLAEATPLTADSHKKKLLSNIDVLTDHIDGLRFLYDHIDKLTAAGILVDTMWEDPAKLVPSLVGGTLLAGDHHALYEILSELRLVALAMGKMENNSYQPGRARDFLEEVLVKNLDMIFPSVSSQVRKGDEAATRKIDTLFSFLTDTIPVDTIKGRLATEIELICLQRPIVTDRVLQMIRTLHEDIPLDLAKEDDRKLQMFVEAVYAPSEKAGKFSPAEYEEFLEKASRKNLEEECRQLASTMRDTGLSTGHHALLLRQVAKEPGLLKMALGLDKVGRAELENHQSFVKEIIGRTIYPDTARSCYGLAKLLERSLLSQQPVKSGFERMLKLTIHPEVSEMIRKASPASSLDPVHLLAADCLGVLGQPLGIGQGWNPTCQSARGISLWSSHAPGKLLRLIETAASENDLSMRFEGQFIHSENLLQGLARELDYNLDAVSIVLVPHLDKIYNEMMRRASNRGEDPHKWVNPAMYGHWIPSGFISAYDYLTNSIKDYEKFIRTFYMTHHPEYNGGHNLTYPNPVGIFLTSSTGKLIGFHAVSILRIRKIKGQFRVYILNPNNEGRQRWQDDIRPTVAGNGEWPGESSLPFYQFASRLYAFHFNSGDLDDISKVDSAEVQKVKEIARNSWGESYIWYGQAGTPYEPKGIHNLN